MNLEETLGKQLSRHEIERLCHDVAKADLLSFINHPDDRVAYNALWVFSYFSKGDLKWLRPKYHALVDYVLSTGHVGKQRLLLTVLDRFSISKEDVRTDYLDFCMTAINSNRPCSIRTLCLKQAFAICQFYPELTTELKREIELMSYGELSPGLVSIRKNILKKISKLEFLLGKTEQ